MNPLALSFRWCIHPRCWPSSFAAGASHTNSKNDLSITLPLLGLICFYLHFLTNKHNARHNCCCGWRRQKTISTKEEKKRKGKREREKWAQNNQLLRVSKTPPLASVKVEEDNDEGGRRRKEAKVQGWAGSWDQGYSTLWVMGYMIVNLLIC